MNRTYRIISDRWKTILPVGYVRQQSFVSIHQILSILKPKRHKIRTILDAACGRGAISCYLAIALPRLRVTGFDISRRMIRATSKQTLERGLSRRIQFHCADLNAPSTVPHVQPERRPGRRFIAEVLLLPGFDVEGRQIPLRCSLSNIAATG